MAKSYAQYQFTVSKEGKKKWKIRIRDPYQEALHTQQNPRLSPQIQSE